MSLRYHAAKALARRLGELEPWLGEISVLQQPPDRLAKYPAVAILPERFSYTPWYEDEVEQDGESVIVAGGRALLEVGSLEGSVRIWAGAAFPAQREAIEESILRAFHAGDVPGRLEAKVPSVRIGQVDTGYDAPITWTYGEDVEWRDEMVFSQKRWSFTFVGCVLPVLILKRDAYRLEGFQLALTQDLERDFEQLDDVETYSIDEEGAVTAL